MWIRLLPYIIGIVGFASIVTGAYVKGRMDCQTTEQVKQLEAVIKHEDKHEKLTQEIIRLPADDLRRRYCKWVRDDIDQCLQADIPIQ